MKNLLLLLAIMITGLANADQITVQPVFGSGPSFSGSGNGIYVSDSFFFTLPQFDPTLGILDSVSYMITDIQQFGLGINDADQPYGLPYQYTLTGELKGATSGAGDPASVELPIDTTCSITVHGLTSGQGESASEDMVEDGGCALSASGTVNPEGFIGPGYTILAFASSATVSYDFLGPARPALFPVGYDEMTLELTYNYTPVPEPRTAGIALVAVIACFSVYRRTRA